MNYFLDWAITNKVELIATFSGLVYVFLSIRQSLNTWIAGFVTSFLYCQVFYAAKFYAGMCLQGYYLIISVYGWWSWNRVVKNHSAGDKLRISYTTNSMWVNLIILSFFLTLLIYYLLSHYNDSPLPFWDAFTSSLSIIATWMLAQKKIEHWLIWICVDLICVGLYLNRSLYPTVFLFLLYTILAFVGYFEWRREFEIKQYEKKFN